MKHSDNSLPLVQVASLLTPAYSTRLSWRGCISSSSSRLISSTVKSPSSCTAKECANSTVHLLIGERIFEGFLGALGLQIKLLKIALQLL